MCFCQEIWRERSSRWHHSHQSNRVCRSVQYLWNIKSLNCGEKKPRWISIDHYLFSFVRCMCVRFTSCHVLSCVFLILVRSEFRRFPFSWYNFGAGGWLKWLRWQGNHSLNQAEFRFWINSLLLLKGYEVCRVVAYAFHETRPQLFNLQGLAGGKIIVYPSSKHPENYKAEENIIVGNVCFYGSTAGKVKVAFSQNGCISRERIFLFWLLKDLSLEEKLALSV